MKRKGLFTGRQKQIVTHALKLFVTKGYDNTTIEDISAACSMSKGNFYNYFDSKEDLVYLISEWTLYKHSRELELIDSRIQELGPIEALRFYIGLYIQSVNEFQDAYNFLNHVIIQLRREGRQVMLGRAARVIDGFERLVAAGVRAGVVRDGDTRLIALNITRICGDWAANRWYLRKFITLKKYIAQQTDLILNGILTDKMRAEQSEAQEQQAKRATKNAHRLVT